MDIMVVLFVCSVDIVLFLAGTGFTFRLNFGGTNRNINAVDNYCVYIGELEASVTDAQLYSIFKEKYISFCGAKVSIVFPFSNRSCMILLQVQVKDLVSFNLELVMKLKLL